MIDRIGYSLVNINCAPIYNDKTGQYELISYDSINLYPETQSIIDTGMCIEKLPDGYVLLLTNRDFQANNGIYLPIGIQIVSAKTEGSIKILLRNSGVVTYKIKAGHTKVALLTILPSVIELFNIERDF